MLARGDAVSIEIMLTLSMEAALEIVAEVAQLADFEDVIAKLEDKDEQASLGEDKMAEEMAIDTPEDNALADWEKVAITKEDTAASTNSDAKSTARQYRRANKVWNTFQVQGYLSEHKLSSKEL
jgi:hypothetical protein